MSPLFHHGHAVIVGVGQDLPMTVTDAQGVASVLKDPGRCAYPKEQVKLLTEGDATRVGILESLDHLGKRCASGTEVTAVVYFSGHGGQREDDDTYFLVPAGYDSNSFHSTAITGDEFAAKIEAVQAERLLVILDCCHAGGLTSVKDPSDQVPPPFKMQPLPSEVIDLLKRGRGRAMIASCQPGEESYTGYPYSIFTAALLEGLAGYGARHKDGVVELADLIGWIGRQVPQRSSRRQNPVLNYFRVTAEFPLAYYAGGGKQVKRFDWSTAHPNDEGVRAMIDIGTVDKEKSPSVRDLQTPIDEEGIDQTGLQATIVGRLGQDVRGNVYVLVSPLSNQSLQNTWWVQRPVDRDGDDFSCPCQFGEGARGVDEYFAILGITTDDILETGKSYYGVPKNALYSGLKVVKRTA